VGPWDVEADVVIVGFGGAGSAAAITAADLGCSVVILEKQGLESHTPTTKMLAGGAMLVTDLERGAAYLDKCAGGLVPYEVSRAWATKAVDLAAWIGALHTDLELLPSEPSAEHDFEGREAIVSSSLGLRQTDGTMRRAGGIELFEALAHAVAMRHIPISWSSPARRLCQSAQGAVVGVEFECDGRRQLAGARLGVVLACGGFEFNESMKDDYLPTRPCYFYTNPGNTGDGIVMAQAVGASLWHMNQLVGRGISHFTEADEREVNVAIRIEAEPTALGAPGYVITDKYGNRFANEYPQARLDLSFFYHLTDFDPEHHEFPRVPSFCFFDERRRAAGPLTSQTTGAVGVGLCTWSDDNLKEVAKGWIAQGGSVAEAAQAAGLLDPRRAEESVFDYNELCRTGRPDRFGRPPETLVPLDAPPFYCLPIYAGGVNTCGGPRRNELGQVLDPFGHPIPGLFAAGELGQGIGAVVYPAAFAYYSEVFCSGRIAGATVARAQPSMNA
jgi:succinate dehydrogenase/fumarate reductase flavoprotein subunit